MSSITPPGPPGSCDHDFCDCGYVAALERAVYNPYELAAIRYTVRRGSALR